MAAGVRVESAAWAASVVDPPIPSTRFGSVAGEERWLASDRTLTAVWALTCLLLAIPLVRWWPIIGGSSFSHWLIPLTAAVATVPIIVYLGFKGDSVYPRWAAAHRFHYEVRPKRHAPDWGIQPFNVVAPSELRLANFLEGDVNGFPAMYFKMSGEKGKVNPQYRYVFALELPRELPRQTLAGKPVSDRNDAVGYLADEGARPLYRYGANAERVRAVFSPGTVDAVLSAVPKRMRKGLRFDTVGNNLIAFIPRAFRAEEITAVFLAMYAIAAVIPSDAWVSDDDPAAPAD